MRYLTAKDIAERFQVSRSRAYRMVREMGGREFAGQLRVSSAQVSEWVAAHTVMPVAPGAIGGAPPVAGVYFVRCAITGLVKIGVSNNIARRVKGLRSHSPVPLELVGWTHGDIGTERALHKRFAKYRAHGEWFRPHRDVMTAIEKVIQ